MLESADHDGHFKLMEKLYYIFAIVLINSVHPLQAEPEALRDIERLNGIALKLPEGGWEVGFQLRGQKLNDGDMEAVVRLGSIVSLNLRDTQITSAGLAHLKKLSMLRRLHLERTKVDDAGIGHLTNLQELEYLNLYGTKVSDEALEHLGQLNRLRKLYLWQTRVTKKGVNKLKKVNPKLDVSLGIDLSTVVVTNQKEAKKKTEDLPQLEWLSEEGAKRPPDRSYTGSFIMVYFENNRSKPVKLYWINYNGEQTYYADIDAGHRREQTSYSRAVWLVTDLQEKRLGYFVTDQNTSRAKIPLE